MQYQLPKGTFDIIPYGTTDTWRLSDHWQYIEKVARALSADYNYLEIRPPLYETTALFDRGIGETSDIVSKEMFSFEDKGGRPITLRPEGTASVMRAFIENHLANLGPVHKFFYIGPMFRYERPQSGRYRQHHQWGVEAIGHGGPEQDAEVIDLLCQFYRQLGLKNLQVHINTVGDLPSRAQFKEALLAYLKPYFSELSADSQARLERNPLRILDSKDPKDKEIIKGAPSILNHLTVEARQHFDELCQCLEGIGIPYLIDDKIVRGLDYYHKTVFEVLSGDIGAQNTLGGGGRYDGLLSTFGGPDLPGVGFATGLERVLQAMIAQNTTTPSPTAPLVYFLPMGIEEKKVCFALATQCRHQKIAADIELHSKKMQTGLQNALRARAKYCAILGSNELKNGQIQLKNLHAREQKEVSLEKLIPILKEEVSHD